MVLSNKAVSGKKKKTRFLKSQKTLLNNCFSKIYNEFLLAGDKFMSKLHLRQPRLTYTA